MSQDSSKSKGFAYFDLDQTLVPWDTQLLFCDWVLKAEPARRLFLLLFLPMLVFRAVLGDEGMKRVFLCFLWGMRRDRLAELVDGFVEHYVPSHFYEEMLEVLRDEREAGRTTVLVTASPEIYAHAIGARLGFDHTFGTRVEYGDSVPLFPDFIGGNNKGAVKVERLREEFGAGFDRREGNSGFSDSKADLPMLELCAEVTAVHPEGMFAERAEEGGWTVVAPVKPWRTRGDFARACLKMLLGVF